VCPDKKIVTIKEKSKSMNRILLLRNTLISKDREYDGLIYSYVVLR
jgi:hypothetical protein